MRTLKRLAPALALSILGCSSAPPPDSSTASTASTASAAGATSGAPTAPTESAAPTATAPAAGSSAAATGPAPAVAADELGKSNQFAARGYATVVKQATGNVFVSPPSLRLALGMTLAGAEGKTAEEMANALGLDADPGKLAALAKAELAGWKGLNGKDVEVDIANRLWGEKSLPFEKAFLDTTRDGWGAPLEPVDFKTAFEPARKTINAWVKKETKDKIPELLPSGSLDNLTRLVVTNAIYFNGKWATPFDKKATSPGPFNVPGAAAPVSVPMMHKTASYKHGAAPGVKLLEMPYGKGDVAMVIVLPEAQDGLSKIEADLSYQTFAAWRGDLKSEGKVEVALPSFEFSYGGSFKETLKSMGIQRAFTDGAEFEKIAKGAKLRITDVFHKAYVKVDESGTEAAAASGVVIGTKSIELSPKFVVDHPFLFYLHDTRSGRVLFVGRVLNPATK